MRRFYLLLAVCLTVIVGLVLHLEFYKQDQSFRVIFFDVGQGDAALINFVDGEKMLVDCGANRKILTKLGEYMSFFDRTIDYLVVTHPDGDHYGGCVDVLKRYEVKNIIYNGLIKNDSYWQIWDEQVDMERAVEKVIKNFETVVIASTTLEFLASGIFLSSDIADDDANNQSVVFRLTNASTTFLFTGDMEVALEKNLLNKYCVTTSSCEQLRADVLKVGHHGSDSSSWVNFLQAVNPKRAVISVGKNKYGHPSARVIKRLERLGVEILRTDEEGDIIMK